jgi:hypothetical protein
VSAGWEIREGDVLERLHEMPDSSIQCCITSPPYYGLRDYGTGEWEDGDPSCDHLAPMPGGTAASGLGNYDNGLTGASIGQKVLDRRQQYRDRCRKCGASRVDRQIGLEDSPDTYIAKLVEVFREVKRVLRSDGTLWLNLGDSYTSGGRGDGAEFAKQGTNRGSLGFGRQKPPPGYKPKNLLGMPWAVAFALRADGWYLGETSSGASRTRCPSLLSIARRLRTSTSSC